MQQVFQWINEPATWSEEDGSLSVVTDEETDFWRETWYGFERFSGHIYATEAAGISPFRCGCAQISAPCMTVRGLC